MKRLLIIPFLLLTTMCFAQTPIRIMDKDGHKLNINSNGSITAVASGSPTFTAVTITGALSVGGDITTTGTITGLVDVTLDTTATIVLTAADTDGAIRVNNDNDAIDYTLPNAATGLNVVIQSMFAQVVTIDCFDTNESIVLDGTTLTAGNAIDSPGIAGDYILLVAISATQWVSMGRSGNWIDGGAD
jgi:hypothetical protein